MSTTFEILHIKECVLKVNIHCNGCKQKVKKILKKIQGVYSVDVDTEEQKVKVYGNVDSATLIKKLVRSGKYAEVWPADNQELTPNLINGGTGNDQIQIQNLIRSLNLPKSQPMLTPPGYPRTLEEQMALERSLKLQGMNMQNLENRGWDGCGFVENIEGSCCFNGGLQGYDDEYQSRMPMMNVYHQSHLSPLMNRNMNMNMMNMNRNMHGGGGMGNAMVHDGMYMHQQNHAFPMYPHAHCAASYY